MKAIEVIKKVKKRKKDWVTGLRHLNTLWDPEALVMRKLLLSGLTQVTSSRIRTLGHNVKELQVCG